MRKFLTIPQSRCRGSPVRRTCPWCRAQSWHRCLSSQCWRRSSASEPGPSYNPPCRLTTQRRDWSLRDSGGYLLFHHQRQVPWCGRGPEGVWPVERLRGVRTGRDWPEWRQPSQHQRTETSCRPPLSVHQQTTRQGQTLSWISTRSEGSLLHWSWWCSITNQ